MSRTDPGTIHQEAVMDYAQAVRLAGDDAKELERLYRSAQKSGLGDEFSRAIEACYQGSTDNPLYAAWHYRLEPETEQRTGGRTVDWKIALPVALVTGIVCAVLSLPALDYADGMPAIALIGSLVGGIAIIAYLAIAGHDWRRVAGPVVALLIAGAYVILLTLGGQRVHYRTLMIIHLSLLAATAVGVKVLAAHRDLSDRFGFLLKAIEVCVVGGVYVIVGGMFAGIAFGLFEAIGVSARDEFVRMAIAAGGGAITVLAVATVYDPRFGPAAQRIERGLGRIVRTMFRLLLPLALIVLIVYLFVIPFNFMVPFEQRDVLIVYNIMLFAVVGLLIGASPLRTGDMQERHLRWLRAGIVAVAALATIVSLYALSATVYRTALGGITINRLTVIGWNLINIGLLVLLSVRSLAKRETWVSAVQMTFTQGAIVYVAWTLFLVFATPWMFL
jgi:hypothetical protein